MGARCWGAAGRDTNRPRPSWPPKVGVCGVVGVHGTAPILKTGRGGGAPNPPARLGATRRGRNRRRAGTKHINSLRHVSVRYGTGGTLQRRSENKLRINWPRTESHLLVAGTLSRHWPTQIALRDTGSVVKNKFSPLHAARRRKPRRREGWSADGQRYQVVSRRAQLRPRVLITSPRADETGRDEKHSGADHPHPTHPLGNEEQVGLAPPLPTRAA